MALQNEHQRDMGIAHVIAVSVARDRRLSQMVLHVHGHRHHHHDVANASGLTFSKAKMMFIELASSSAWVTSCPRDGFEARVSTAPMSEVGSSGCCLCGREHYRD